MKIDYDLIDGISPLYRGSRVTLRVDGYVEPSELLLTALEYSSLKEVILTLIQENFDNAPKIEEIVREWYKKNETY